MSASDPHTPPDRAAEVVAMALSVSVVFGRNPATGQTWLVDIWTSQEAAEARANQLNALRTGVENGHQFRAERRRVWEKLDG